MNFKGFKAWGNYYSYNQLLNMKISGTNTIIPIEDIPHEECYTETIKGIDVELVCDRKSFSFPVYRLNLDAMCDGRSKIRGNGEPVDFDLMFQDKRTRKALIDRIDDWQDPYGNNYIGPNIQNVMTPEKIAKDVCSQFESEFNNFTTSEFWVLFNLEFVEELVFARNVKRSRVKFFTDNVIKAKWATKMYGVEAYVINIDEFLNQDKIMPKSNKIIVIGNPPYQYQSDEQKNRMESGNTQAKPIYNKFIETIIDFIKPNKLSMIVPSKWMVGGMGLQDFRSRMLNDTRISNIVHFPGNTEVFGECASVGGGVNYFLWDSEHNGMCSFKSNGTTTIRPLNEFSTVIQDNVAHNIFKNKINNNCNKFLNISCYPNKPFGISTNFKQFVESGIPCITKGKQQLNISKDFITDKFNIIHKYKVCCPAARVEGSKFSGNVWQYYTQNQIFLIHPGGVCSETYVVVNAFDTQSEAENFLNYMKTKFFRFFLGLRVVTQHINKEKFSFVPDQEDYTRSYTDEYLYQKYNLTTDEINYIESKIKTVP